MIIEGNDPAWMVQKFLKGRRNEETRQYTLSILQILIKENEKDVLGWTRVRSLFDKLVPETIPNQTTFYRLLKDLYESGIIERKVIVNQFGKGRKPVFYRLPVFYPKVWLLNRDELIKSVIELEMYQKAVQMVLVNHPDIRHQLEQEISLNINKLRTFKEKLVNELQKPQSQVDKEAAERMKNFNLEENLNDELVPWKDLDNQDKEN